MADSWGTNKDALIDKMVKLRYTHGGQVWIPGRIACGGTPFFKLLRPFITS